MDTMCKVSCLTAITALVFILVPVSPHCAAEDPQDTISEQNLFRPEGNEGVHEKTGSVKKNNKADASHLELYGTVILGDKKRALIFDNSKQRMDEAQKQEKNKRAGVYYLGDSIGGYVISAIEEERVELDYRGEKVILTLRAGKETNRGDYTPLEEPPASAEGKSRETTGTLGEQDGKKLNSEWEAGIKSSIMSSEEAGEIVEFSKEILEDIEKGGEDVDQNAIEQKREALRKMFLEKLGEAQETDKEVR